MKATRATTASSTSGPGNTLLGGDGNDVFVCEGLKYANPDNDFTKRVDRFVYLHPEESDDGFFQKLFGNTFPFSLL